MPPVLVVEDDPVIRRMLREILEEEGYQVYEAPDGAAALARMRMTSRRLIVLLSIMMPIMDGVEVMRAVVADSTLSTRHRYIMQTASPRVHEPEVQSLLAQLDAPVLSTPFPIDAMIEAVERAWATMS